MTVGLPDIITFELLDEQRKPLTFILENVSHVTREALLQKIFSTGLVSMLRLVLEEGHDGRPQQAAGTAEFLAQGEPISPHPFRRIPARMTVDLSRLQQLALSDLLQHERLDDPRKLMDRVINAGLHSMYDAAVGADLELSVEEQIEMARKAKRPPVAPTFASAVAEGRQPLALNTDPLRTLFTRAQKRPSATGPRKTAALRRQERRSKLRALLGGG